MTCVEEHAVVCIEPRKKWLSRTLKQYGISTPEETSLNGFTEEEIFEEIDVDDDQYLKSLDPRNWKDQDHYAILGLKKKRYRASEKEIRRAYRRKILVHHPDKRNGEVIDSESDYFACITKAFETLGDPIKRRAYDSIDPTFDDDIPSKLNPAKAKKSFISTFGPIIAKNARWSVTQPVPLLGTINCRREEVDKFYSFWYDFDSWREYSYLDEEDKERGQDREERRWIEKENRAERQKKKKEEMARIRQLVDNAYASDPRIARFKEEEKQRKLDQKKAKEDARKAKVEEEEKLKREQEEKDRIEKEAEEDVRKIKKEQEKKEKEALKKQKKKIRKNLEQLFDNFDHFSTDYPEKIRYLEKFDKMCLLFSVLELNDFKTAIESTPSVEDQKHVFDEFCNKLSNSSNGVGQVGSVQSPQLNNVSASASNDKSRGSEKWPYDDCQLLIKAVNLFPAGTKERWEVVTTYLEQHSTSKIKRKARDVLARAKELQKMDPTMKQEANNNAFKELNIIVVPEVASAPSERFDTPQTETVPEAGDSPWSDEEQQMLEQAMKTYPASVDDRWGRIAECLANRSKKEVIQRVRDLVQQSKAKKAALEAVSRQKAVKEKK